MKKYILYPLLALIGGIAAFALRLMQNRTGYESSTGLPTTGNFYAVAVPVLLIAVAVLFLFLVRRLPTERGKTPLTFSNYFRSTGAGAPALMVMGAFLWIASGALHILSGFVLLNTVGSNTALYTTTTGTAVVSPFLSVLVGVLSVLSGVFLFPVISACRYRKHRADTPAKVGKGGTLLIPVACLVIMLVITYREDSVNPTLSAYYVELLAIAGMILTFYRTVSFAYREGRTRRFVFYALITIVLCSTALADAHPITETLFYGGGALLILGFVLLRIDALVWTETPSNNVE